MKLEKIIVQFSVTLTLKTDLSKRSWIWRCNLSKMGQVSWWYFPQENDRRAATESGVITYTYNHTLINFLFKEQIPEQLNSLLTWQDYLLLLRWERQDTYYWRGLNTPRSLYAILSLLLVTAIPLNIPQAPFLDFLIYPQCCTWPFQAFL